MIGLSVGVWLQLYVPRLSRRGFFECLKSEDTEVRGFLAMCVCDSCRWSVQAPSARLATGTRIVE